MNSRNILFDVYCDRTGETDVVSKATFKASEILKVKFRFVSPYEPNTKLSVMRPGMDVVNIAERDLHGDSGNLRWSGLLLRGRADLFIKTPVGTSTRVIGVIEIVGEIDELTTAQLIESSFQQGAT